MNIEIDDLQGCIDELCAYMIESKDYDAYDFVCRIKDKYNLSSDWIDNLEEAIDAAK